MSTRAAQPPRLLSLDAFRGLVILAMLIVNNIGDHATTGYFWQHADWIEGSQASAYRSWWSKDPRITQFPLFKHCTLADFVMPGFMLIIGIAIPFGLRRRMLWLRVLRRAFTLVLLGWILCYFRDQFAAQLYGEKPFHIALGMDVLQLLGVSYLVARVLYDLPPQWRISSVVILFLWHWGVLRFAYQGADVPRGTFTAEDNAIRYIYAQDWWLWRTIHIGPWISMNWKGLLSVPPAAATMLLGTLMGEWIRRDDVNSRAKAGRLAVIGAVLALVGFLWAFDLPFNKPRWSPAYLVYASGVLASALALLYWTIEVRPLRRWSYVLVVLGVNAIAAYFFPILAKVLLLNTPRVRFDGATMPLINAILLWLKSWLGAWIGGWTFTFGLVGFWWLGFHLAYRRKLIWKV